MFQDRFLLRKISIVVFLDRGAMPSFLQYEMYGISIFCISISSSFDVKTIIRLRENTNRRNMSNSRRLLRLCIFIYFMKGNTTKKRVKSLELLTLPPILLICFQFWNSMRQSDRHWEPLILLFN